MTDVTHNIRENFFVEDQTSNAGFRSFNIQRLAPSSINLSSGVVSGSVTWNFALGADEWLDFKKTMMVMNYTYAASGADSGHLVDDYGCVANNLLPNLFSQAIWKINGVQMPTSNNWTQDWTLSNRISESQIANENLNKIKFSPIVDYAPSTALYTTRMTSTMNLAGFCLLHDAMLIPPNSTIELQFTVAGTQENYVTKAVEGVTSADVSAVNLSLGSILTIAALNMDLFIYSGVRAPPNYRIRIVSPESTIKRVTGSSEEHTFYTNSYPIAVAVAFQDININNNSSLSALGMYKVSGTRFLYDAKDYKSVLPADNADSTQTGVLAGSPLSIQFAYGNNMIPATPIDNSYTMFSGWSQTMRNINQIFGNSGEYYAINSDTSPTLGTYAGRVSVGWKTAGPYWLMPVVHMEEDRASATRFKVAFLSTAPSWANMICWNINEGILTIGYNSNGAPTSTILAT